MKPSVGRIVHYVSYGTPDGEYGKECRAAIVTEVGLAGDAESLAVGLCVLNPTGQFFNRAVPCHDDGTARTFDPADAGKPLPPMLCDGNEHPGGTWHWPARV